MHALHTTLLPKTEGAPTDGAVRTRNRRHSNNDTIDSHTPTPNGGEQPNAETSLLQLKQRASGYSIGFGRGKRGETTDASKTADTEHTRRNNNNHNNKKGRTTIKQLARHPRKLCVFSLFLVSCSMTEDDHVACCVPMARASCSKQQGHMASNIGERLHILTWRGTIWSHGLM